MPKSESFVVPLIHKELFAIYERSKKGAVIGSLGSYSIF